MVRVTSNYLVRRLVIPASTVGAVALSASLVLMWIERSPWLQDLAMNVAVTALGALATVLYIDRVMQNHEARRWSGVTDVARHRIKRVARKTLLAICIALDAPLPDITPGEPGALERRGTQQLIDTARRLSRQNLMSMEGMDQATWQQLAHNVDDARQAAERVIELVGGRIGPAEQERLLLLLGQLDTLHQCCELRDQRFAIPNEPIADATAELLRSALAILEYPDDPSSHRE